MKFTRNKDIKKTLNIGDDRIIDFWAELKKQNLPGYEEPFNITHSMVHDTFHWHMNMTEPKNKQTFISWYPEEYGRLCLNCNYDEPIYQYKYHVYKFNDLMNIVKNIKESDFGVTWINYESNNQVGVFDTV